MNINEEVQLIDYIPDHILDFIQGKYGKILGVDKLAGVNEGRGVYCFRIQLSKNTIIVKKIIYRREFAVYQSLSSFLKENKVYIPELYYAFDGDKERWIVIEDIPTPFPKSRWKGDRDQIELLFRLHSSTWNKHIDVVEPFIPEWKEELNIEILKLIPIRFKNIINKLHQSSKDIFQPFCCITGDPNPTNWGLRNNGELVLFDFERFGYGSPAIDLAITIPGLGSIDYSLEKEIARIYIEFWEAAYGNFSIPYEELVHQIVIAKIWSVLDFLMNNADTLDEGTLRLTINQLIERLENLEV